MPRGVALLEEKTICLNLRRFLIVALVMLVAAVTLSANPAEAARKKTHKYRHLPDRSAEIVIEASTGYVVSEKNADRRLYPASLTKMMTLYLAFEALSQGKLDKNQYLAVSRRAASQAPSSLGLQTGDAVRVENAILAIATKSANDCAVALAEALGGSEDGFARAMTMKARQLGMNSTNFINASGLHDPNQFSTARDMAVLSRSLIRDYPRYYRYFSTGSFTYEGNTYFNHNKLMSSYQGMDGLKTGYVYASGFNLASSAVRNGTRLIGVVFGGETARSRNRAMEKLLDRGFARISSVRIAALAEKMQKPAPVQTRTRVYADSLPSAPTPQFDATDVMMDQGDTDANEDNRTAPDAGKTVRIKHGKPPLDKKSAPAADNDMRDGKGGGWAIQIGSFSSRNAGMRALETTKTALPEKFNGKKVIAPLLTNRGMIYRAKLAGLARNDATQACRILKGNCLILAAE